MINKNGSLLYLFDFDGTLCGDNEWNGLIKNCISCFRNGPHIKPSDFDIRWGILTGRPKIDLLFIKLVCMYYGFNPNVIFTSDHWRYNYKKQEDNYSDKLKTIKNILDGKIKIRFTTYNIEKIFYIDNDFQCIKYLNSNKDFYRYLSMGVKDFYHQNLTSVIL